MNDEKLYKAWQLAAADLDIRIHFPVEKLPDGYGIMIKDFGGPKGMVVSGIETEIDLSPIEKDGFYISLLGQGYEQYERTFFIDTLNDWGYFGDPDKKPDWYTGNPWTE